MYKTNVLHVIDTLGVGGAEKLLVGIVNGLEQFNHHVVYLNGSDELAKNLSPDCRLLNLHMRSKKDTLRCVLRLKQYIRENKIEIVHSHLVMATTIARLACSKKIPLFTTLHSLLGSRFFKKGNTWQRMVEKITYKKRHHVIAVSGNVLRDYDNAIGIKGSYTILPNFVENDFFANEPRRMSFNGTLRLVSVGNLKAPKNYSFLVEAFKELPKGIHLDIYGDGPLKEELQKEIDEHKLNIRLCGLKNNVHELLRQYDLFVMSSTVEGHPIALLEAMASGMPAIVSDIPVLKEATGEKALYFSLDNTKDFVKQITAIANHQVDLDVYARANLETVKAFASKERYMFLLKNLYAESLLSEKPEQRTQPVFRPALNLQTS